MSRPDGVPAEAEILSLMNFLRTETVPSVVAPGAYQRRFVVLCPVCKEDAGPLALDSKVTHCGVAIYQDCANLYIWRETVPA
jgi:hypothetical protein